MFYAYKIGLKFLQNRVVGFLTIALNYHFGGLNVTGYHVVNLLIHLAASLLVYALLRLTFRTPYFQGDTQGSGLGSGISELGSQPSAFSLQPSAFIPLFAALLFVIHPVQTQAVTYIVQRMASLATMFYLLSVVLYVKARLRMEDSGVRSQESEEKIQNSKEKKSSSFIPRLSPGILFSYIGSILAAVLAMKVKEIAFTLPLSIVLYEIFFFQGAWKRRLLYLLPLLATLPIIPISILDIGGSSEDIISTAEEQLRVGSSMSRQDYLFTQFRVIVTYLRLLVLPVNQNLDYDYPVFTTFFTPPVFLSFLLLTAIFTLALYLFWRSRWAILQATSQHQPVPPTTSEQGEPQSESKSQALAQPQTAPTLAYLRLISFGIIWFFLTLSVESSLVPIKDVFMEHRLYLPFFGAGTAFAMIFYMLLEKLTGPSSGKLLLLSATILVLLLGVATYQRNHVWGDAIRLWQDVVDKSPNKARPINNLGAALEEAGRRAEAYKAFSKAIKLDPAYYKAYYNLADLYLVSDQPDKALPLLQTAIRLKLDFTEAYVGVGAALMRAGKFREVTIFLEQNLHRVEDHPEAHFYLGASYAFLGNREAAIRELAIVSRGDPALAATLAGMLGLKSRHVSPNGR